MNKNKIYAQLIKGLEAMREQSKIPYQALQFGDSCPKCGQEMNRKWVDDKCKEIRVEALSDAIQKIKSKVSIGNIGH